MRKVEVSPMLISTDAASEELKRWQNRSLDSMYPIVYFDAIVIEDPARKQGLQPRHLQRRDLRSGQGLS